MYLDEPAGEKFQFQMTPFDRALVGYNYSALEQDRPNVCINKSHPNTSFQVINYFTRSFPLKWPLLFSLFTSPPMKISSNLLYSSRFSDLIPFSRQISPHLPPGRCSLSPSLSRYLRVRPVALQISPHLGLCSLSSPFLSRSYHSATGSGCRVGSWTWHRDREGSQPRWQISTTHPHSCMFRSANEKAQICPKCRALT